MKDLSDFVRLLVEGLDGLGRGAGKVSRHRCIKGLARAVR